MHSLCILWVCILSMTYSCVLAAYCGQRENVCRWVPTDLTWHYLIWPDPARVTCLRSVALYDLKDVMGRHHARFRGSSQQDAHEFLMYLLDFLHEDLNEVHRKQPLKVRAAPLVPSTGAADRVVLCSLMNPPLTALTDQGWQIKATSRFKPV